MLNYERIRSRARAPHGPTRRKTAFYALAVGVGHDPLDEAQLAFVDPDRDLVALPSMATVIAYPGMWMADPAFGVDYTKGVNGEQGVVFHQPLPVAGEVIGTTRVTGVVDKGSGRGALVYTERVVRDAKTGAPLATVTQTGFLRGDGGYGGPSDPERPVHPLPERPPDRAIDLTTRPEQALFYRFNGDDNPLHVNPRAARAAGFPRPILHGLCTFGVTCHALVRGLCDNDPARMTAMEARFSAPVFPGETIRTEMWSDGSFRARVLERDAVVVTNGRAAIRGASGSR